MQHPSRARPGQSQRYTFTQQLANLAEVMAQPLWSQVKVHFVRDALRAEAGFVRTAMEYDRVKNVYVLSAWTSMVSLDAVAGMGRAVPISDAPLPPLPHADAFFL